jgi:hypothetical protein
VRQLPLGCRGAIVPHAPLLLAELSSPEVEPSAQAIRSAIAALDLGAPDVVVVLSPHGKTTGVYGRAAGSLTEFGVDWVTVDRAADRDAAAQLARAWGRPVLDADVDHGVLVALRMLDACGAPVVAAALAERDAGSGDAHPVAHRFAAAVTALAHGGRVAFVASANTSAALSRRAPFTERAEAVWVERLLLEGLPRDAGCADDLADDLARRGLSCGVGPLAAFGRLFRGAPAVVDAYESPVGIGYLVAHAAEAEE